MAQRDLGIVDGLVQLSTLVQSTLGSVAARHDLSLLQSRLLGVLRDREPTMAQLGRLLDLDKSSTTGLVDRAARHGLVTRVAAPEDGRVWRVTLTEEGRRVTQVFAADMAAELAALTGDLSPTNRHRLSLLVSALVHHHADAHGLDLATGVYAEEAKSS